MVSDENQGKSEKSKQNLNGNKTLLIIISCWFLFYIFISLNGGGG